MKKTITAFSLLLMFFFSFGQAVDREQVIVEIGTGTGCPFCPGAAMGADDLVANGKHVGVIEYHSYNASDPFNNSYASARTNYYGITGFPTAYFDGVLDHVGGSYNSSLYSTYLPLYNQRIAIPSDFTIEIAGNSATGEDYNVNITVNNVNNNTQNNLRLMVAVTESDIPYNWQGQNHLDFVERTMLPNANGTNLDFSTSNSLSFSFNFSMGSDWDYEHCQLVAFVQNHSSKECLQGALIDLPDLVSPMDYNASLKGVYVPRTLCSDEVSPKVILKNSGNIALTSLDFTYKLNDGEEHNYAWTGNLALGESETVVLPGIAVDDILDVNEVSVEASNPNGNTDEYTNDNVGSAQFTAADDFVNPPNLQLYVKTDDNPEETTWELKDSQGNVMQSGGPYSQASHLYIENLDITDNGCYSFTIYDAGGNGFTGGTSKYFLSQNGNVYYMNTNFGYMEETQFTVGLTAVAENFVQNSFSVYPNPVAQTSYVMYELGTEAQVQMKMYNNQGKEVLNIEPQTQNAGLHSIKIDGSHLPNGIYFIDMQVNEDHYKKKIVVMN